MNSRNKQQAAPPGQMVDAGGFRLHTLVCGQGAPTVVFEPGLGGFALQYSHLQAAVSAFTRGVAYDRAGQGWSDRSANPRTPLHLAGELKALLRRLDLQPPYVLVGHSFGGLLTRFYAGFYPEDVAGVVLVDSSDVEQYDTFPSLDKMVSQTALAVGVQKFVSRLGLGKQLTRLSLGSAAKVLSKEDLDAFITIGSQPSHQEAMLAEFSQHRFYFGAQSQVPRTLGDTPLIIVTAGNSVSGQGKFGGMTIDQLNEKHQGWQKNLLQLSTRSEQIILPGATHLSILTQPEYVAQVAEAIRRVVEIARGENPSPTILETERLFLRRFTTSDLDELYRLVYADPRVKDTWSGATGTQEEIKARFAAAHIDPPGDFGFRAIIRKADGALLGLMGFQLHEPAAGEEIYYLLTPSAPDRRVGMDPQRIDVELTYALGHEYWKQGYATEMGKALIDWGFRHLGIARILQGVLATNANSINLMRRLGFSIEEGLAQNTVVGVLEYEQFLPG